MNDIVAHQSNMSLDHNKLNAAKKSLDQGAVTPDSIESRKEIIKLLNDSLATEIVCALRYKRHYFTATGLESVPIAEEFLVHANEEQAHADKIAKRIVQLGGEPDFNPQTLLTRSHAEYNDQLDLHSMIRSNLVAERVAIEAYTQMIDLIGNKDHTTRRILEQILEEEQEHADELADWMRRAS